MNVWVGGTNRGEKSATSGPVTTRQRVVDAAAFFAALRAAFFFAARLRCFLAFFFAWGAGLLASVVVWATTGAASTGAANASTDVAHHTEINRRMCTFTS